VFTNYDPHILMIICKIFRAIMLSLAHAHRFPLMHQVITPEGATPCPLANMVY
jgi:hypothetical protein